MDTQFLTQKELEKVLSVVTYHNRNLLPSISPIAPRDVVPLVDSNGEMIGTLVYTGEEDEYVFHYPATTISKSPSVHS